MSIPRVRLTGPVPVILLLILLPALSAGAVVGVDQFGTTVGMFLFVGAVIVVTLLTATRFVPETLYPLAVFCVSASVLVHRNMLTDHVVGADIQVSYFISNMLLRTHLWAPDLGGSMMSLSAVTSVPASITMLTGIELATTFKLVYAFLFSLVPVALFYVNRRVFDEQVALYGSLFFVFYHGSFYFTPGKQLMSELSVVAVLLLFAYWDVDTVARKVVLFVLAVTLISSHYGMTYALGGSLMAAYVGLRATQWAVGDFDHDVSLWYPVVLLGVATAFYGYSAPDLLDRLASIPFGIVDQLLTLAVTGIIPGSGVSYLESTTGPLDALTTYLYVLLTGLVSLGLTRDVVGKCSRVRSGESPGHVEYTALAVPFFVFLASSYIVIPNLYADRVYQMTLVLLAPYVALGYLTIVEGAGVLVRRAGVAERAVGVRDRIAGTHWSLLVLLLAALLALNSGLAFSLAGSADTSSFDAEANDLTFTTPEREAVRLLGTNVTRVERYDRLRSNDAGDTVTIYTEPRSYQLFRATVLPGYTNTELRYLKSRWRPTLFPSEVNEGYVFVRERSIADVNADDLPPWRLSREQVENLSQVRNLVYTSEAGYVMESNTTAVS